MSLGDDLDRDFAPAWRPAPGEKLIGRVTDLSGREGTFGPYPIVTLRTASGEEFAIHAFHEVLANELARIAPKVGDEIGVKYEGKDRDKGYHRYRVRTGGESSSFSWSKFGGDDAGNAEPNISTDAASEGLGDEPGW